MMSRWVHPQDEAAILGHTNFRGGVYSSFHAYWTAQVSDYIDVIRRGMIEGDHEL
jgi:hypothetical protein